MAGEYEKITTRELVNVFAGENKLQTTDGLVIDIRDLGTFKRFLSKKSPDYPSLILISGTSESGKSTFGKLAVASNIGHRLKFYRTLADLVDEGLLPRNPDKSSSNPFDYATWLEDNITLARLAAQSITSRYLELMRETDVPIAVVETIKHPWIITELRRIDQVRSFLFFIDADFEKRVTRQAAKTGKDLVTTKYSVSGKDSWKLSLGTTGVKELSDAWITNNGSYGTYEQFVLSFLQLTQENSRIYSGKSLDLSEG